VEIIRNGKKICSIVVRSHEIPEGTLWYGSVKEPMQACSWNWHRGKEFKIHRHLLNPRVTPVSQEALVVIKGKVQFFVMTETSDNMGILYTGDMIVHYSGAHGYKILKEGTKCYEFKTGPCDKSIVDKEYV
jgi:hypothetical protein